jgi:methionyl-tRNA formyltransferase
MTKTMINNAPPVPVVFFGSDAIALPLLESLWHSHTANNPLLQLEAVVTQPNRRSGRGQQLKPNIIASWAEDRGLNVLKPQEPNTELLKWLSVRECQLALVMAYGHLLKRQLREAFPLGMLNFHASLLPQLRGASPVESAIAQGFGETGVSLMQIVARMDAGPVADFEKVTIGEQTTGAELRQLLAQATSILWQRNSAAALAGELQFQTQDESKATYCYKLTKADGLLDFTVPAVQLANRVRAYADWPGCFFEVAGQRIKVGAAQALPAEDGERMPADPGAILAKTPHLDIATGKGVLRIFKLQKPGGKMLEAAEFLRGFDLTRLSD